MKQWQVIAGDCRVLLPRMAPGSVDFIFADPSYGHNNNSDRADGRRASSHQRALNLARRALSPRPPTA